MKKFERSWMLEDYWALIVLPPGLLAASADDLAHATAASGLEAVGRLSEARLVYESVINHWPSSLSGLIGLSNLVYASGDAKGAASLLSRAVLAHDDSAAAWHNLAIAQGAAGDVPAARESARQALKHATSAQKAAFVSSLHDYLSL